jgi:hypothetical protein
MYTRLPLRRIATAFVEARCNSFLDLLDNVFILALGLVDAGDGIARHAGLVVHVSQEANASAIDRKRHNNIDGQSPGIEIEHRVREEPVIVRCYALTVIRRRLGKIEGIFCTLSNSDLHVAILVQFRAIGLGVQKHSQIRYGTWNPSR